MTSMRPKIALAFSALVLIGVAVGLAHRASADPQVVLAGRAIRLDGGPVSRSNDAVFEKFWVRGAGRNEKSPFRKVPAIARAKAPASSIRTTQPVAVPSVAPPQRISIPAIGVDAVVDAVGLQTDGSMEIPEAANAGWYHFGATPGQRVGSAVIAGHVDHKKAPGVFIDLPKLELGEEIVITDTAGLDRRFVVTERYQVAKDALPAPELFRLDGAPTLTLITCGGRFDRSRRHYDDNIVIRAVPLGGSQRA
jgi:Sortase domain